MGDLIPKVDPSLDEIELKDIQIPDPDGNTPEEVDRLRQIIWKKRHLLMGKGNALPPAARGAICDIECGNRKTDCPARTESGPSIQREVSRPDQGTAVSEDHSTFYVTLGQPNRDHCEEEWGRHQIVYRLPVGERFDATHGLPNASD